MTVTRMYGWEGRAATIDDPTGAAGLTGTAAYSTVQARTGVASIRCNPASGASGNLIISTTAYIHFGFYVVTLPSVARQIFGQAAGDGVYLNTNGTLAVKDAGSTVGTSSAALVGGTWYWIGVRCSAGSGALLQIDGTTEVSGTATLSGSNVGPVGTEASAIDTYIDDIIIDDTGFLAPSKVDTAFPISDNTVTGVTDNNGVATNIWQCVDNAPPIGVASANEAANPKAGMHFPASTTCNYLANLETYTTLGVASGDTVLAVQSFVRQGEDIATGTKNLQNVGALTNPTVAGASVTAGSDGGAHGAETGLWVTTVGTLTTRPSVTLGTSPTIRVSRTSESRLACADFMAMVVAWTPAPDVPRVPYFSPYPQLLPR